MMNRQSTDNKLKVAFINQPLDHVLPPHQNSIGIWTYQVARRITDACDITCYAKLMQGETGRVEYDGAVRYKFMRMAPIRAWDAFIQAFSRFYSTQKPLFATAFTYIDFILPIAWDIRRNGFDVVHIHNFTQFVPVVRALNPSAKIILHMNGEWLSQLDANLMAKRIEKADLILGSSDHIRDLVRQRFPQFVHKVETVFNGVDTDHFIPEEQTVDTVAFDASPNAPELRTTDTVLSDAVSPGAVSSDAVSSDEQHILFVGRISPEKGLHILMDAFALVGEVHPNVKLLIVGPEGEIAYEYLVGLSDDPQVAALSEFYIGEHSNISYLENLRRRIPSHLKDRVIFTGPIAQKQLLSQYQNADILVNPSFSESFGMSLAEAMACGKPVVASRVGGMKGIVQDGVTGHLVHQGDPQALANALSDLLKHPEKCRKMGAAGRTRSVSLFSWNQVSQSWLAWVGAAPEAVGETALDKTAVIETAVGESNEDRTGCIRTSTI